MNIWDHSKVNKVKDFCLRGTYRCKLLEYIQIVCLHGGGKGSWLQYLIETKGGFIKNVAGRKTKKIEGDNIEQVQIGL